MKSIDTVILSLAAALMLAACGDVIEIPDVSSSGNGQDIPGPEENPLSGDVVFTATAENLPDGKAFTWKKGCEVTLYDGISARTLANEAGNGVLARFPATLTGEETGFLALSPASENVQFSPGKITLQMPAVRQACQRESTGPSRRFTRPPVVSFAVRPYSSRSSRRDSSSTGATPAERFRVRRLFSPSYS